MTGERAVGGAFKTAVGIAVGAVVVSALAAACTVSEGRRLEIDGLDVKLTLLHTSDIHSRLIPYDLEVGEVDRRLGLLQDNGPFGGAARLAYLVKRERGRAGRCLYIDTGDPFQGAPIFNFYAGEAEIRVLSELDLDVLVIGNHEFDRGATNLGVQLDRWARFPAVAANYRFVPSAFSTNDLARIIQPFVTFGLDGLRVAVIGVGDSTSMHSIFEPGNRLGITPTHVASTVQTWVDFLRPLTDVVIVATHQGLRADEEMIRGTTGIDVVLGGHLHIVLDPPKTIHDCRSAEIARRGCTPRPVVLAHSGAFLKFLGRLDLVLRQNPADPVNGYEVVSRDYALFPVDSTVPEDPAVAYMLEPYVRDMEQLIDLGRLIGYAPRQVRRFGTEGGDSQLGNLVADAMWLRAGIETDFALTNTTGIRANLDPGPVTIETLINVFPFDNTITTMFLSGAEVQELFDYVARRTASRGCSSQVQIAGARVTFNCRGTPCEPCAFLCGDVPCRTACTTDAGGAVVCPDPCPGGPCTHPCDGNEACAEAIFVGSGAETRAIDPIGSYEMATNNYLAGGGSGYTMLRRNTTQQDSGIQQRDAVIDRIRSGRPCVEACTESDGTPLGLRCGAECARRGGICGPVRCESDSDCDAAQGQTCACPGRWRSMCDGEGACTAPGACVLAACIDDVADMYARRAVEGPQDDPVQIACRFRDRAGAECAEVACVDGRIGAEEDGRIRAYLP